MLVKANKEYVKSVKAVLYLRQDLFVFEQFYVFIIFSFFLLLQFQ